MNELFYHFDLSAENSAGPWEREANQFAANSMVYSFTAAEMADSRESCGVDASFHDVLQWAASVAATKMFFREFPRASESICFSATLKERTHP